MGEKTICFKIDEEFHKRIKLRIAKNDETLAGYINRLIKDDFISEPSFDIALKKSICEKLDAISESAPYLKRYIMSGENKYLKKAAEKLGSYNQPRENESDFIAVDDENEDQQQTEEYEESIGGLTDGM